MDDDNSKQQWTVVVFAIVLGSTLVGAAGWSVWNFYAFKSSSGRLIRTQAVLDAEKLVQNFDWQVAVLINLPNPFKWSSMKPHVWENILSLVSLFFFGASIVMLVIGVTALNSADYDTKNSFLVAAIFTFTISSSLFVTSRQFIYYQQKERATHLQTSPLLSSSTHSMLALAASEPRRSSAILLTSGLNSNLPNAQSHVSTSLDVGASSTTPQVFYTWNWTVWNFLQLVSLLTETLQMMSFPIRELIMLDQNTSGQVSSFSIFVDNAIRIFSLIPNGLSVSLLYFYQFWTFFVIILCGLLFFATFLLAKFYLKKQWSLHWVFIILPFMSILYLPFVVTFSSSAACLVQLNQYRGSSQCTLLLNDAAAYAFCTVVGFLSSYVLMTLLLSADERKPQAGQITFKSQSTAFMKNMSFLLVIVSSFLPSGSTTRGIFAFLITFTMCAYNIRTQSCFVYQINCLRSGLLILILWTILVTHAAYQDDQAFPIATGSIITLLFVGYFATVAGMYALTRAELYSRGLHNALDEEEHTLPPCASISASTTRRSSMSANALCHYHVAQS